MSLKVQKDKARDCNEEHQHLINQLNSAGNYFSWEVHPNRVKATEIFVTRIRKKIAALITTEEFLEENPHYRPIKNKL